MRNITLHLDGLTKILKTQSRKHCKIVELPSECTPSAPKPPGRLPLPCAADECYRRSPNADNKNIELDTTIGTDINKENEESVDTNMKYPIKCEKIERILRTANGRVVSLEVDSTCKVLGCYGIRNSIELFCLLSDTIKDRLAGRLKKKRREAQKEGNGWLHQQSSKIF